MDSEEDDNIIFLLLVASGIMNLSSVLSKKQIKYIYNHNKLKKHNNGHWKSRVSGSTKKEIKNNTLEWKIDKYNKPREILKGLKNGIWKTRVFSKKRFFESFSE